MSSIEHDVAYMSVRTLVWGAVATIQVAIVTLNSNAKQREQSTLTWLIAGATALFFLRNLWLLVFSSNNSTFVAFVRDFLNAVSLAGFLGVLLLISSGYCITTARLQDMKRYIFVLPVVFLVSTLVFDWMIIALWGVSPTDTELWVLVIAAMSQAAIFIVSWIYILDNTEAVAKQLEAHAPRADGANVEAGPGSPYAPQADPAVPAGFQAPPESGVTTVGEEVERLKRAGLMRRYKIAVSVFMFAYVLVVFVPSYGEQTDEAGAVVVIWDALLLGFLAVLAWVFRARPAKTQYLHVGPDEDNNIHLETHLETEGRGTQVMTFQSIKTPPVSPPMHNPLESAVEMADLHKRDSGEHASREAPDASSSWQPGAQGGEVDKRFTLDEE